MMYTIQAGDNLWMIANRFGVSLQEIMAANPGLDPQHLYIGQQIWIPRPSSPVSPGTATPSPQGVSPSQLNQIEEILGQHRRQIADLQRRVAALEQRPR